MHVYVCVFVCACAMYEPHPVPKESASINVCVTLVNSIIHCCWGPRHLPPFLGQRRRRWERGANVPAFCFYVYSVVLSVRLPVAPEFPTSTYDCLREGTNIQNHSLFEFCLRFCPPLRPGGYEHPRSHTYLLISMTVCLPFRPFAFQTLKRQVQLSH